MPWVNSALVKFLSQLYCSKSNFTETTICTTKGAVALLNFYFIFLEQFHNESISCFFPPDETYSWQMSDLWPERALVIIAVNNIITKLDLWKCMGQMSKVFLFFLEWNSFVDSVFVNTVNVFNVIVS